MARIVAEAVRWLESAHFTSKQKFVVAGALTSLFGVVTAFGTVQDKQPLVTATVVREVKLDLHSVSETAPEVQAVYWHEDRFGKGDTFASLLQRLRVNAEDVGSLLRSRVAQQTFQNLRPGTSVQAEVNEDGALQSLRFVSGKDRDTLQGFDRVGDKFQQIDTTIELTREIVARSAQVGRSLFAAADRAGVPDSVATQLSEVFGAEIDFHRDFGRGERFSVVYEMFFHNGRLIRPGRLLAAEITRGRRVHRAVWFESGDTHGYYSPDGRSLKQQFLRAPMEVSRITSGFEMRILPGSKVWQEHKGIDYAAPVGTPVRATGDGMVEFMGQQNGYGNVIVLKHKGDYSTLYAHMHEFADGLSKGSRVAQGDLIGAVGQTGWATGPHLHYEFRVKDEYIDPLNIALPSATPLGPAERKTFRSQSAPLVARLDLVRNTTVAMAE
jgi:murein DD-endopeptidase MepM/ murein hydrolase activator NlpD